MPLRSRTGAGAGLAPARGPRIGMSGPTSRFTIHDSRTEGGHKTLPYEKPTKLAR